MGIYDRPYYGSQHERGAWLSNRSLIVNLILVNVAVYLIDYISEYRLTELFALRPDLLTHPWQFYQLLTYGFVHDRQIPHILFNMYFLWLFGAELEQVYGKAELLRVYLVAIVLAGLAWVGYETAVGEGAYLVGASGGIMCLMILFVCRFPKRMFSFWGILPMPAWVLGAIFVGFDLFGLTHPGRDNVANIAHLAGVAFGLVYFRSGINLGQLVPRRLAGSSLPWRTRLKIHDPDAESSNFDQQVDEILKKIGREGEASLSRKERRSLEEASRRYQDRRR